MPISNEFIRLFKEFVDQYKKGGWTYYLSWSKEPNHKEFCDNLEELLSIIEQNQNAIHDKTIIDHLNSFVVSCNATNPDLWTCWRNFIGSYQKIVQAKTPQGLTTFNVEPPGSEQLTRELQKALSKKQQDHAAELKILNETIKELQDANNKLSQENADLKHRVLEAESLKGIKKTVGNALLQLNAGLELLQTAYDLSNKSPGMNSNVVDNVAQVVPITQGQIPTPPPLPKSTTPPTPSPRFFSKPNILDDIQNQRHKLKKPNIDLEKKPKPEPPPLVKALLLKLEAIRDATDPPSSPKLSHGK